MNGWLRIPSACCVRCSTAGLAYPADRIDHTRAARDRGLSSASCSQVTEPLYRRASGAGADERHLAPIMDVLRPWADHWLWN
jgi:hypothetical protein